jgi:hypothetical protein
MKIYCLLLTSLFFFSCNDDRNTMKILQSEINYINIKNDSLEKEIQSIKPGLGDLMLMVQVHHNKLFFAGKNADWPLAQFEHDEIMEILAQAETIENERTEVKLFRTMIYPQLDSIQLYIKKKDAIRFAASFTNLTTACNNCHTNTKYSFNKIIIPAAPPYTNQEFTPVK